MRTWTHNMIRRTSIAIAVVAAVTACSSGVAHAAFGLLSTNYSDNYSYRGWAKIATTSPATAWRWTSTGWRASTLDASSTVWAHPFAPGSWTWAYQNGAWYAVQSGSVKVLAGSTAYLPLGPSKWKIARTYRDDRVAAASFLNTAMGSTRSLGTLDAALTAGYELNPQAAIDVASGTKQMVHVWKPRFRDDGVADPSRVDGLMFDRNPDGSWTLVGGVFTTTHSRNPDLGLGTWHVHHSTDNPIRMKHIWFMPDDLDMSFDDSHPDHGIADADMDM